jgi:hypothetical protein
MEVELHPVDGKTVVTEDVEPVVLIEPAKRSRGRPPGAKNKARTEAAPEPVEIPVETPVETPVEESSEESAEPEPIVRRKKKKTKVVVESESEEELPKRIRRKKPEPPPLSPRAHAVKLRQDYHNQRVQGYTNLLSEMLSY